MAILRSPRSDGGIRDDPSTCFAEKDMACQPTSPSRAGDMVRGIWKILWALTRASSEEQALVSKRRLLSKHSTQRRVS